MAGRDAPGEEECFRVPDELQQLHPIVDILLRAAEPLRDARHRVPILSHQRSVALGLLQGIEVLTLQVLEHDDLTGFRVAEFSDDHRDLSQAGSLRSAGPPLAGEDLEPGAVLPDQQGDQDPFLPNAGLQLLHLRGVEMLARIRGVRGELGQGKKLIRSFCRGGCGHVIPSMLTISKK